VASFVRGNFARAVGRSARAGIFIICGLIQLLRIVLDLDQKYQAACVLLSAQLQELNNPKNQWLGRLESDQALRLRFPGIVTSEKAHNHIGVNGVHDASPCVDAFLLLARSDRELLRGVKKVPGEFPLSYSEWRGVPS
jgi:hypothetical protein